MNVDRAKVSFLRELCERHDGLLVWKHLDRALIGRGDIDAAAPRAELSRIQEDACRVARRTLDASYVIRCDHGRNRSSQFFVQMAHLPQLFEFDISHQPSRLSGPWARPDLLKKVARTRPDGIRGLRPGAEAVVSLVLRGISSTGIDGLDPDERDIVDRGVQVDLPGALLACETLPPLPARVPMRKLVLEYKQGTWSPSYSRLAYLGFGLNSASTPIFAARRILFRARMRKQTCLMFQCARDGGRRIGDYDLEQFMLEARRQGHQVDAL